jgi:hypothetical protein
VVALLQACGIRTRRLPRPQVPVTPRSGSSRLRSSTTPTKLIRQRRTSLGIHKYDDTISDLSVASFEADSDATKAFSSRLDDVDAQALSSEPRGSPATPL